MSEISGHDVKGLHSHGIRCARVESAIALTEQDRHTANRQVAKGCHVEPAVAIEIPDSDGE